MGERGITRLCKGANDVVRLGVRNVAVIRQQRDERLGVERSRTEPAQAGPPYPADCIGVNERADLSQFPGSNGPAEPDQHLMPGSLTAVDPITTPALGRRASCVEVGEERTRTVIVPMRTATPIDLRCMAPPEADALGCVHGD